MSSVSFWIQFSSFSLQIPLKRRMTNLILSSSPSCWAYQAMTNRECNQTRSKGSVPYPFIPHDIQTQWKRHIFISTQKPTDWLNGLNSCSIQFNPIRFTQLNLIAKKREISPIFIKHDIPSIHPSRVESARESVILLGIIHISTAKQICCEDEEDRFQKREEEEEEKKKQKMSYSFAIRSVVFCF